MVRTEIHSHPTPASADSALRQFVQRNALLRIETARYHIEGIASLLRHKIEGAERVGDGVEATTFEACLSAIQFFSDEIEEGLGEIDEGKGDPMGSRQSSCAAPSEG